MTPQDSTRPTRPGPGGRWLLAPGALVVPRGPGELQVGRGERAVVVPDDPVGSTLLDRLATSGAEWNPGDRDWWWARLLDRGLLVPLDELVPALRRARCPAAVSAAYAALGPRGTGALAAREGVDLVVGGWTGIALDLARRSGLPARAADEGRDGSPAGDVWLVAGGGTDQRELTDSLLRAEVPHLLIRVGPLAGVRVGPFVAPGSSPCLHCLEAAAADHDPAAGLVDLHHARAEAAAALPGVGRMHAGAPWPEDPSTVHLAVAWAVRDLLTWAEGDLPATWATTIDLDRDLAVTRKRWTRHPRCGCAWDLAGDAA